MPRRYVLALAVIAVLFFLGIWLLISLITGGDSVETTQESGETIESAKELTSDTNSVSYTVYGPVVGEEQRRAIRIVVTANERRAEVLRGYYETIRSWSTSCGSRQGSFLGDSYLVQTLMQKQIPNYLDFASGVQIY